MEKKKNILQIMRFWLLLCFTLTFLAVSGVTWFFQTWTAQNNAEAMLEQSLYSIPESIRNITDVSILQYTEWIADDFDMAKPQNPQEKEALFAALLEEYEVPEMSLTNEQGVIIQSSHPELLGLSLSGNEMMSEFLVLLEDPQWMYVGDEYQPSLYDSAIQRQYAGVPLKEGGMVLVGYDAEFSKNLFYAYIGTIAEERYIGKSGFILISDEEGTIISSGYGETYQPLSEAGLQLEQEQENQLFQSHVYGMNAYCMYSTEELLGRAYTCTVVLPESEVMAGRNTAVVVMVLAELILFAVLFTLVYILLKKLIVENLRKVNAALEKITAGNLEVMVNVRENEEFSMLSDDINATVATLKEYIAQEKSRIDEELELARQIQYSVLPSGYPLHARSRGFDIYASMDPAREVGGDFYDFYLLQEDRLAFLIADVSGKGIPAAMFMMTAKTLMKNFAEAGMEVAEVFAKVNNRLCEGNEAMMFVTAWMGILDLKTRQLQYVNAGHNPPAIRQPGKSYIFLETPPNFVLGGMEHMEYQQCEIQLEPGDELYLYTDGITEAQNTEEELFGEERLLMSLNRQTNLSVEERCRSVKQDVDAFAAGAEQFDDMTMLCIHLNDVNTAETGFGL